MPNVTSAGPNRPPYVHRSPPSRQRSQHSWQPLTFTQKRHVRSSPPLTRAEKLILSAAVSLPPTVPLPLVRPPVSDTLSAAPRISRWHRRTQPRKLILRPLLRNALLHLPRRSLRRRSGVALTIAAPAAAGRSRQPIDLLTLLSSLSLSTLQMRRAMLSLRPASRARYWPSASTL